jgi:membrane associated rhomboid family serine protease/Zn-finger nucleic acid-binding protein
MSPSLGLTWVCPSCRGRAVTLDLLRHVVPRPLVNRLWQRARSGQYPAVRRCPACRRLMAEVPIVATESKTTYLDVCTGCHFVWFDTREFEGLPKIPGRTPKDEALTPKRREARALAQLEILRQESQVTDVLTPPDHWWQFALALFGIPAEYNDTPLRSRPLVTWLLAAVIAGVSLTAMGDLKATVENWGLIPAEFGRHYGLTFLTSFLLHGGLFHLLGNLYFLVVFGDNTEDVLGRRRYLLLVATAALVGDITHILTDPRATIPCVGASGGISGILAYYCLRFPRARVGIVWWFHWIRLPVGVMFALWVLSQILGALWISSGFGNVAVFAHLGGAAVGVLFWWGTRRAVSKGAWRPEAA